MCTIKVCILFKILLLKISQLGSFKSAHHVILKRLALLQSPNKLFYNAFHKAEII